MGAGRGQFYFFLDTRQDGSWSWVIKVSVDTRQDGSWAWVIKVSVDTRQDGSWAWSILLFF